MKINGRPGSPHREARSSKFKDKHPADKHCFYLLSGFFFSFEISKLTLTIYGSHVSVTVVSQCCVTVVFALHAQSNVKGSWPRGFRSVSAGGVRV